MDGYVDTIDYLMYYLFYVFYDNLGLVLGLTLASLARLFVIFLT
jgi:hypothetical protein